MILRTSKKQRLTLVFFLLYFLVVGCVQPFIAQVSPKIFSNWFVSTDALTERRYIATYYGQFATFSLSVICTIFLFDHFVYTKIVDQTKKCEVFGCSHACDRKGFVLLLIFVVILDVIFRDLIGYGVGKITAMSHPGMIVVPLNIVELLISLYIVSGEFDLSFRYLYAVIAAVISAIPSIVSGSRGVLVYRLVAYLLAAFCIEGRIIIAKKSLLWGGIVAILVILSLNIGNYARYGKLLDFEYLIYRFTGYADGINAITVYLRDAMIVDEKLTLGNYLRVLFHRSISGVIRCYSSLCFNEVTRKYCFDVNVHNQALPSFSAWFLYFRWAGVVIGGVIEALFLCITEFLMKNTNRTFAFLGGYAFVTVFLGIVVDGNVDGWITVMIPVVGVLMIMFMINIVMRKRLSCED